VGIGYAPYLLKDGQVKRLRVGLLILQKKKPSITLYDESRGKSAFYELK